MKLFIWKSVGFLIIKSDIEELCPVRELRQNDI